MAIAGERSGASMRGTGGPPLPPWALAVSDGSDEHAILTDPSPECAYELGGSP